MSGTTLGYNGEKVIENWRQSCNGTSSEFKFSKNCVGIFKLERLGRVGHICIFMFNNLFTSGNVPSNTKKTLSKELVIK